MVEKNNFLLFGSLTVICGLLMTRSFFPFAEINHFTPFMGKTFSPFLSMYKPSGQKILLSITVIQLFFKGQHVPSNRECTINIVK